MGTRLESTAVNKLDDEDSAVPKPEYPRRIVWTNVLIFLVLHLTAFYGLYLGFYSAHVYTSLFCYTLGTISGYGITAGAHRLWAHRAYKATWQLQVFLVFLYTLGWENSIIDWVRDHRVHHKYSETDADPHNAKRGFFFAHMGWLLVKKHPDVRLKGKGVDLSDLERNPILRFQRDYFIPLLLVIWGGLPTAIPVYLWNETWGNSFFIATMLRYVLLLHFTWLVNSAAHLYGNQPYDKSQNPAENRFVSYMALGEGWHNYHHVFPWDYKAAELGYYRLNMSTAFIDFFAWIGWAYDLKTVPVDVIKQRVKRTGDGTHQIWGWGDKDQSQYQRDRAIVLHPSTESDEEDCAVLLHPHKERIEEEKKRSNYSRESG